jgi:hypothetical protein
MLLYSMYTKYKRQLQRILVYIYRLFLFDKTYLNFKLFTLIP